MKAKSQSKPVLTVVGAETVTFITQDGDSIVCRLSASELKGRTMESIFNEGVYPAIPEEEKPSQEDSEKPNVQALGSVTDPALRAYCEERHYPCDNLPMSQINFMNRCWALGEEKARIIMQFRHQTDAALTSDGDIMLFKGCAADGKSWHANTSTIIREGKVTSDGHIIYEARSTVVAEEDSIPGWDGYSMSCVPGLYAGTESMASSYGSLIFRCSVRPEDIRGIHSEKVRATAIEIHDVWQLKEPYAASFNDGMSEGRPKMFRSIPLTLLKRLSEIELTSPVQLNELCGTEDNIFIIIAALSTMGYHIYQKHSDIYVEPR